MKLDMSFEGPISHEQGDRNRAHVSTLGLVKPQHRKRPPLAVVGGGPSVLSHLDELKSWDGDIWIVCGAFPWAMSVGLEGTFFNADVQALAANYCAGAKRALVSTHNDPAVFAALEGVPVEVFDLYSSSKGSNNGTTTATAAPCIALEMGHQSVSFFGCDSSYEGRTHAYDDIPPSSWLRVRCGGQEFDTSLPLLGQALCLAEVIREEPQHMICRSGGLLAALVGNFDYELVATTRAIYMALTVDGRPLHEIHPPRSWAA
jgi:hypothetical protein